MAAKGTRKARKEKMYTDLGLGPDGTLRVGLVSLEALGRGEIAKREAVIARLRELAPVGGKAARRMWLTRKRNELKALNRALRGAPAVGGWQGAPPLSRAPNRLVLAFPTPDAALTRRDLIALSGLEKAQVSVVLYQNRPDLFEKIANADYDPPPKPTFQKDDSQRLAQYLWTLTEKGRQLREEMLELKSLLD